MKKLLIAVAFLGLCGAGSVFAAEVGGKFIYKMPAGNLVVREVTLDVPAMGQGELVLKYSSGSVTTTKFRHSESRGRVTFDALFMNPPGAPQNTALVLTGAYLRGSNGVLYYGDAYTKIVASDDEAARQFDAETAGFRGQDGWNYSAAFEFDTLTK